MTYKHFDKLEYAKFLNDLSRLVVSASTGMKFKVPGLSKNVKYNGGQDKHMSYKNFLNFI